MSQNKNGIGWQFYSNIVFGFFFFILMIALLLFKYTKQADNTINIISDLATIFFSLYAGYVFNFIVARKIHDEKFEVAEKKNQAELQFSKEKSMAELQKVSRLMGRRILNLTEHLRKLAEEISDFEIRDKKSEIYLSRISAELTRLAIDASSSVEDVEESGEIKIPSQEIVQEIRTKIYTSSQETFRCPKCHLEHKISIETRPGSTRHKICQCGAEIIINRSETNKIIIGLAKDFIVECPNQKCKNRLNIKRDRYTPLTGIGIRNCYECKAKMEIDMVEEKVVNFIIEDPLRAITHTADTHVNCPNCKTKIFIPQGTNSKGEKYTSCRRCTKLIQIIEEEG